MEYIIRPERESDIRFVSKLTEECFGNKNVSLLVTLLRARFEFIKALSIVAEIKGAIAGYVLLSPVQLQTEDSFVKTLWLEPVCVHPDFQLRGIGKSLITDCFKKASGYGFDSIFVTGDLSFYSRFGFRKASEYCIDSSLYIPEEAFLTLELKENSLPRRGKLIYPKEIFD